MSCQGRVRGPRVILTPFADRLGYRWVSIGKAKHVSLHRLVLATFVGQCPEGSEARHLNDDKGDNRLVNLAWGTKSENTYDRIVNGKHVQARKTHCPHGHPYDETNTRIRRSGARQCKTCAREEVRRRRAP